MGQPGEYVFYAEKGDIPYEHLTATTGLYEPYTGNRCKASHLPEPMSYFIMACSLKIDHTGAHQVTSGGNKALAWWYTDSSQL